MPNGDHNNTDEDIPEFSPDSEHNYHEIPPAPEGPPEDGSDWEGPVFPPNPTDLPPDELPPPPEGGGGYDWDTPAPVPPPNQAKCECCIAATEILNIRKYRKKIHKDTTHFGHEFDFMMWFQFNPGNLARCNCRLEWWEYTNIPVKFMSLRMKPFRWTNLAEEGCTDVKKSWENIRDWVLNRKCPAGGWAKIPINDKPGLAMLPGRTAIRHLRFKLAVNSCPNGNCAHKRIKKYALQVLGIINGKIDPSLFWYFLK
ncbi:hypothetical protein [Nitrosopumilus sp. b2]|uniref:hypothetical protein n=1 Tax=Nitrosopumilus sp. b2 TaxID=2109908 RepID=UPI0015F38770|nr:hypothetical protein [Nitrosopumilus sp. b2]KAF6244919.1 hypothetical protein C6989_05940 [Nitrosopumilus sp. b2]